jgi:hypothetical protein
MRGIWAIEAHATELIPTVPKSAKADRHRFVTCAYNLWAGASGRSPRRPGALHPTELTERALLGRRMPATYMRRVDVETGDYRRSPRR